MSRNTPIRDPLFENKLIAALLVTALIVVSGPVLIFKLSGAAEEQRLLAMEEKPAAPVVDRPDTEDFIARLANADPTAGERESAICASCHTFDRDGENLVGPNLWGIVGRDIASVEDAYYSAALEELEGVWTPERLDQFLADPDGYVPGTIMLINVRNADDRADLITWLMTLKD